MILRAAALTRNHLRREIFPLRPPSVFSSSSAASTQVDGSCPAVASVPISRAEVQALVLRQFVGGKFRNLVASVVSQPALLLAACGNITPSDPDDEIFSPQAAARFGISVEHLSRDLREGEFDLESCCVRIVPSRVKGESLVLPNLKLKVVMEAIRITLEEIYDPRFCTFSYGGRPGIGRHTAVRYLKSAVQNPSWWFRVALRRHSFESRHFRNFLSIIEDKIDDPPLIELLRRLFVSEILFIEFGGTNFGRGFPQENRLSLLLLNIYLNNFDQVLEELRLQIRKRNPRIVPPDGRAIFHNPIRLYAVRYLDEILVITSGSKMLAIEAKERAIEFLEKKLNLEVNKFDSAIHSAVSEKMDFIGMEFQAVPPSVLRPPLSEKAVRARKKHLKQKTEKARELKNARETRRKKLGLKIFNHVFKKLKKSAEIEFHSAIESKTRIIFETWSKEVAAEFFQSKEELRAWHRNLRSGDFLSLKRIRDQLPADLVESYDQLQQKIDEHFQPEESSPSSSIGCPRVRVWEEEDDDVEDLTRVRVRANAPAEAVRRAVKMAGFTNRMGRPRPIKLLFSLDDADIVKWYAGAGIKWLDFFSCCRNLRFVKTVVNYHLRFSCLVTLAEKHESTKREALKHYGKYLKVRCGDGEEEEIFFPTEREIKMMGDRRLSDPRPADGALGLILVKLAECATRRPCAAHFCRGGDGARLYRLRLLQNRLNADPSNDARWVPGMGAIHESLNKKCLALCSKHAGDLYLGRISLQDVDCTSFV